LTNACGVFEFIHLFNGGQNGRERGSIFLAKNKNTLKIIPLGGVGEIGKNMTVLEYENDIIVIDCGLIFPREDMLGVDYVIPDVTYLEKNKDKLRGFVITHGHEDHIGAVPYVIGNLDVPIYGSKLSLALIDTKFLERNIKKEDMLPIEAGDTFKLGCFKIEAIKVSHSIDGAFAYAIHTPVGIVVHTGDFKIDYTPIDGRVMNLNKFAELGQKGVLALLSDSTNAENPGYTFSEKLVGVTFESFFNQAKGRIIVATFASNIHRLQQVVDAAKRHNRKVCLSGRSMIRIAGVAQELNYLNINENMLVSIDELDRYKDNQVVILTTGSQGETMSGLVRMAAGEHPKLSIKPGDLVIISSTPIPGNERYVSDVINMLFKRGAMVINEGRADVHVSGHACQEELKLMLTLTKPKYFIPVHGEYRHLYSHADIAVKLGIPEKRVFIPELGRIIEMNSKNAVVGATVPSGSVLIDGLGIGDVGNVVLRDRKLLSQDGLFIVVVTVSSETGELISGPEIISRGFVYVRESENLMEEAKQTVIDTIADCEKRQITEWTAIKGKLKKTLRDFLYEKTNRSPMLLPIIIEI
jgi:ribonuclease J